MDAVTQPATPRRRPSGFGAFDSTAAGRAQAASNAAFSRYQGLIDVLATDPGLTPEQRAAAIRGLRQQQAAEAGAAYSRIMDDAQAAAIQGLQAQQAAEAAGASKQIMDAAKGAAKARRKMRRAIG